MSTYPTDDPGQPATPLFDETAARTAIQVDTEPAPRDRDVAADRAGQAKDTVQNAAGQAKETAAETANEAKGQAKQVGSAAAAAGQRVASTTKDQASRVASDAVGQARELFGQATEQLSEQAGKQQKNAASTLRTFGADLSRMREQQDGGGLAAELVQTVSERTDRVAQWLEDRDPGDVLDEVRQFAARRPGLFIALAAVTGVVAARATKALVAESKSDTTTTPPTANVPRDVR